MMSVALKSKRRPVLWFPLLLKELIERANRQRTYWIRAGYALVCFSYFGFEGFSLLKSADSAMANWGTGGPFFQKIYLFQLAGTLLFVPAFMSGLITSEKERSSLQILLTTELAPWRIVLQKYIGGLAPMLALQLTALPIGAVAYTLGGVEVEDIFFGAGMLLAHTLQIGAFCLACSAYCRSSVAAIVTAYVLGGIVLGSLVWVFGPEIILEYQTGSLDHEAQILLISLSLLSAAVAFRLSVSWLRQRAEPNRADRLRSLFKSWDRSFKRLNDRMGGIRVAESQSLPGDAPVQWHELHQRSLAHPQHLVRIGLFLEILIVAAMIAMAPSFTQSGGVEATVILSRIIYVLWILLALVLAVEGANVVASERVKQTFDVLLTTPVSGAEILRGKASVYWRIAFLAAAPLATVHGFRVWEERDVWSSSAELQYCTFALLAFLILVPFIYWMSVAIGLLMKSQVRAVLTTIAILVLSTTLPLRTANVERPTRLLSPATAIVINENGWSSFLRRELVPAHPVLGWKQQVADWRNRKQHVRMVRTRNSILTNLGAYFLLMLVLRFYCLHEADRLMGRGR